MDLTKEQLQNIHEAEQLLSIQALSNDPEAANHYADEIAIKAFQMLGFNRLSNLLQKIKSMDYGEYRAD